MCPMCLFANKFRSSAFFVIAGKKLGGFERLVVTKSDFPTTCMGIMKLLIGRLVVTKSDFPTRCMGIVKLLIGVR